MLAQKTVRVQESLTMAEVFLLLIEVVKEQLQVVCKVARDLVFAGLSDVADGFDQLLVGALDVVSV